jgi:homocysteine S-methyltransferase
MVNELRVPVPDEYLARMRAAETPDQARNEGVRIAQEMVVRVAPIVQGVQLSAPFGRYQMAVEVAQAAPTR